MIFIKTFLGIRPARRRSGQNTSIERQKRKRFAPIQPGVQGTHAYHRSRRQAEAFYEHKVSRKDRG